MSGPEPEIRSFRAVFALERRIYRIDTLRLNPGGVPLRGLGYALALVTAAVIAGALPPTSWLDPLLPWYVREIGFPVALAALLGTLRIDGRAFHHAARAGLAHALSRRRLDTLVPVRAGRRRWRPPAVVLIPDGSDARFRALRYRGPGAVLIRLAHERAEWPAHRRVQVTLRPIDGEIRRPAVLELAAGAVLEVRPH